METLLGIRGKDFVMLACDSTHANSIIQLKSDETKIHKISDKVMIGAVGQPGDSIQFVEYISKNIALYKMRNTYELGPKAAAHFTRKNLAGYLRSRTPYQVWMFVAGYDEKEGPELQFMDYLANAKSVKYGNHGYGGMFCASIFDRYHHENITQEEAYEVFKKCVKEIYTRLIINLPRFKVAVIDRNGFRFMDDISTKSVTD